MRKEILLLILVLLPSVSAEFDTDSIAASVAGTIDTGILKTDYQNNKDLVDEIFIAAKEKGINPPALLIAQLYHESARFTVNALRCEDSYESGRNGPWDRLASQLECTSCRGLVSDLSCTYSGCNANTLNTYKSRYSSYHQVSCSYGLGQIMYPTAAGDLGFKGSPSELLEPAVNMRLSAEYMSRQLNRFGGNPVFALAAYNAGPGNVERCRNDDYTTFVNCLPNPQITGKYIARILAYSGIFEQLMAGQEPDTGKLSEVFQKTYGFDPKLSQIISASVKIVPDFKVKVPYQFSEYEQLKSEAKNLIMSCTSPLNAESCISDVLREYNKADLFWQYGDQCISQKNDMPKEFQDFLRYFENCMNSISDGCYCADTPAFGRVIEYFEIQELYGNVVIVGKVKDEERYRSKAYQGLRISEDEILRNNARYVAITKNNFLAKGPNGEITKVLTPTRGCFESHVKVIPFCVRSKQELSVFENNKIVKKPVIYRFALTFGTMSSDPPESARSVYDMTFNSGSVVTKVGEAI